MSDPEQETTYAAEDLVLAWLDETSFETGEVSVTLTRHGARQTVTFRPEIEPRFGAPAEARDFVDQVLTRLQAQTRRFGSNYRGREARPVKVVRSRKVKQAEYQNGVMKLPDRNTGGVWALRGMVVLHELAHHLNTGVDGLIIDNHGEGFRATFIQVLDDIGWTETAAMLREAYREMGLDRDAPVDDGMLAKVGKLLRHAEGASTEEERDAFFSKAQELASMHSIELAVARAAHEKGKAALTPTFETIRLGHRGNPSNVRFVSLILAIARVNDVRCSIRSDNTGITAYGFSEDIEVIKALYATLAIQMVADADAYIRSGAHRPVHGKTARVAFYAGWTDRIEDRLRDARQAARVKSGANTDPSQRQNGGSDNSKALALIAKEIEVDDYYGYMKRQHGVRGTWRGAGAAQDAHSLARGQAAAERARLGSEKELAT